METESVNKYGTIADFNEKNFNKKYVFVLNHNNPKPALEGVHFPTSKNIPLIDEIFDKKTQKRRIIRYVPGEMSIFEDEQKWDKATPPKNYFASFAKDGDLIIDGRETQKLEFFLKCNFNGSNPDRDTTKKPMFWMVDIGKGLKTVMEKDRVLDKAKAWCYDAPWAEVKAYARGINLDISRDPDEIRWALRITAEKDPVKFLAGTTNQAFKKKNLILDAIERNLLTVDVANNSIKWTDGGVIVNSPISKDPVDHLVDSLNTPDGERVYATIRALITPVEEPAVLTMEPPKSVVERAKQDANPLNTAPPALGAIKNPEEFKKWVSDAKAKGALTQEKAFFTFPQFPNQKKIMGYTGLHEFLNQNSEIKAKMNELINS